MAVPSDEHERTLAFADRTPTNQGAPSTRLAAKF